MELALELLTTAQVLILILGGVVIYYASKAYYRTKSRAMLFLALGFGFVTLGALAAGVLFNLNSDLSVAEAVQAISQAAGFFIIVYSLKGTKD